MGFQWITTRSTSADISCGQGCVGQSFGKVAKEKFGLKVISLDHMDNATPSGNPEEKTTILSDVMKWDYRAWFESVNFVPDILTAR